MFHKLPIFLFCRTCSNLCCISQEHSNVGEEGIPLNALTFKFKKTKLELEYLQRQMEKLELQDRRHQQQMRGLTALLEQSLPGNNATLGIKSTAMRNFSASDSTTDR